MREIYIILGWVGWIWLGIVMILLPVALWAQAWLGKRRRRRQDGLDVVSGIRSSVPADQRGDREQ